MTHLLKTLSALPVLLLLIGLSSCSDFLGIRPKDALYPETVGDYENLLNYFNLLKGSTSYTVFLTDDAYLPDNPGELGSIPSLTTTEQYLHALYTYKHGSVMSDAEDDSFWDGAYGNIYYYNTILDNVPTATEGTDEQRERLLAEAKAGRALEYLTLVNCYAAQYDPATADEEQSGVPLILHADVLMKDLRRATLRECYDLILSDLKDALPKLPAQPRPTNYRMSRGACAGILARAYLILGDYEESLRYADEALKDNDRLLDYSTIVVVNPMGFIGRTNMPHSADDPEAILGRNLPYVFGNSNALFASPDLLSCYDEANDKRCLVYFVKDYWGMPFASPDARLYSSGFYENVGISTVEMYLTAAECEARIGTPERALELVDKVRRSRIMGYVGDSAPVDRQSALREVLLERRREFALRGMYRYIDLRRLSENELGEGFAVTHNVGEGRTESLHLGDPRLVMSIPNAVLRMNPHMRQNER